MRTAKFRNHRTARICTVRISLYQRLNRFLYQSRYGVTFIHLKKVYWSCLRSEKDQIPEDKKHYSAAVSGKPAEQAEHSSAVPSSAELLAAPAERMPDTAELQAAELG